MTDKQTGEPQVAGRQGMTRGIFLMGCLVVAALLITIWIKLGSRDVEIELNIEQPAIEQGASEKKSVSTRHGNWYVSLASFRLENDAVVMVKRFARKGVDTDYISFVDSRKGYQWYRVRVAGFASEQKAQDALIVLSKKLNIHNAWVGEQL